MARHKRIPYDPPNKRRKRRGGFRGPVRADQLFLSRRMLVAKGGLIAAFATLAGRLGYLQLVKGQVYKTQAEENVIRERTLPAPRGIIYDRAWRPLARNRRAWEVRVVKANLPLDEGARRRVLDTLVSALQLEDVLVIRPRGVPKGSRSTVFERVTRMLDYDAETADEEIQRWTRESTSNRLVLVSALSIDDAARFRAQAAEMPGVKVMNEIDYLVDNIWAADLPIVVKRDVPRDVAMKLETNSMYLPGVEVDDTALAREYLGGEVMSHAMGYVQAIDGAQLYDLRNRDENNDPFYDQNDYIGREGLENALERDLRGLKGREAVEVDANGVVMRSIPTSQREAVAGKDVRLAIDLEFQQAVGESLEAAITRAAEAKATANQERVGDGLREWKIPNAGSVVAYDPRTGEVLAMVSYPYYDNQLFISGISARKWAEYNQAERGKAFLNRATRELYPPGSTYKIFLAASALHNGTITPEATHSCRGAIQIPNTEDLSKGQPYACWKGWDSLEHSDLNLYDAIAESCDVYFYNVAVERVVPEGTDQPLYYFDWNLLEQQIVSETKHVFDGLGIDKLAPDMKEKFWFGRSTGLEIDDLDGLFPDEAWKRETIGEGWAAGDTVNISIGQGDMQVTPLQLTVNTAALAADGVFRKPHLVLEKRDVAGAVEATKVEEIGKLDIAQEHIDVVTDGMRRVCNAENGTAHHNIVNDQPVTKWPNLNPEGDETEDKITVAGKTGTSEFGEEDDIGARDTHALFTCYAPWEEPEIAVSVIIEAGGEGSTFAVPVADEVLRAYFELTGRRERGTILSKDKLPVPEI